MPLPSADAQMLHTLCQHFPGGVTVIDRELRIVLWNERFLQLLELPAALFEQGASVPDLWRFNIERGEFGIVQDVDALVRQFTERALRFEPHVFTRVRPNGVVLEIRGEPIAEGGFVTTWTDVSEHHRLKTQLNRNDALVAQIVNHLPQGISLFDENLSLQLWNQAFAAVLDFAPQEVGNHLFGSAITAGPDRMTGAGARGVPQIVSIGCYDLIDFVAWHELPPRFSGTPAHDHNRLLTSVVQTADQRREVAQIICEKLAGAKGPVTFFLPTGGGNEWDRTGGPLSDPEALAAFCDEIRARFRIARQYRAQPFNELLVGEGLVERAKDDLPRLPQPLPLDLHVVVRRVGGGGVDGGGSFGLDPHLGARAVAPPDAAGVDPLDPARVCDALVHERREEAEARVRAQATREERLAVADRIVDNAGDPAATVAQVDEIWTWLHDR